VIKWLLAIAMSLAWITTAEARGITAKSWAVADANGRILAGQDIDTPRPIASISKLLTVMIVMDAGQSLSDFLYLSDRARNPLPSDEPYTRRSLIALAMIRSDNRAAYTLCEQYPGGYDACITAMNAKARELGMSQTRLRDPTGLDDDNVSTARDLVKLTVAARRYDIINWAARNPTVEVLTLRGQYTFRNTDPLVGQRDDIVVSKTGYISASGGCIVIGTKSRNIVLLASKSVRTRIPEAKQLIAKPFSRDS